MPTPVPCDLLAKCGKPAFFLTYTMDNNIRRSPEEGGHTIRKRIRDKGQSNKKLDNSWVMPYSPYLLKRFRCLINLEYCATVLSVKYQFPYTIEERLLKRFRCLINLKYCATVLSVKYLIVKDGIFGKPLAHVHVVEFQKRGAPHMHLLIKN
eukprot:scaffold11673_cov102-Skeletonema_dohrnii-CCMP3373.AAC.4